MSSLPTPWYWKGLAHHALKPAALLYRAAQTLRASRRRDQAHEIPLVIVGNPRVGGSGKTPISFDLVERLRARQQAAAWIGRGVGGDGRAGVIGAQATAAQFGDEALMASRRLGEHCYAGVPRSDLIRKAAQNGCSIAVSDDGMQSPDLLPSLLIVVLRAEDPWGNGQRLPAGPLREGPESLERADLIVWHGLDQGAPHLPADADERWVTAWYELQLPDLDPGKPIGLCTSIADPERLRRSVIGQGVEPTDWVVRGDHRRLPLNDLDRSKTWLTTAKDWARHAHEVPAGLDLRVVGLVLRWSDNGRQIEAMLDALVQAEVDTRSSG